METHTPSANWRDYLNDNERERLNRLDTLEAEIREASNDRLKIRKRCWRRMLQARDKARSA